MLLRRVLHVAVLALHVLFVTAAIVVSGLLPADEDVGAIRGVIAAMMMGLSLAVTVIASVNLTGRRADSRWLWSAAVWLTPNLIWIIVLPTETEDSMLIDSTGYSSFYLSSPIAGPLLTAIAALVAAAAVWTYWVKRERRPVVVQTS